ncbi:SGNH/GDSL hydrolase family protein [Acinetobacter sp. F9]|uniref:SGNH/GDSL hydrolase family protein n=1 Tax=Acinetobacter sp. F9 TaxID=2853158 RepID=UPI001C45F905|nr:hypothetical protein [Acinetobacter sp. F9]
MYTPSSDYLENCPALQKNEIYEVRTNKDGNQFGVLGNVSKNKIFMLGASSIECLYLRPSKKIHSVLERFLLENQYDYEVNNLGASGSQSLNIINLLINKLYNKQGSTVILTLPSNDNGPLLYKDGYFSSHRYHSTIIPATDKRVETNTDPDLDLYKRGLGLIKAICEQLELKLILTSICYTGDVDSLNILNNVAREYCKEHEIDFLDLELDFQKNPDFFYDKLHFLPKGSEFFANKIFESLKDSLDKNSEKELRVIDFGCKGLLEKQTLWSDEIIVNPTTKIKLVVDFEHLGDSKAPALYVIDYFCDPKQTTLIKSQNPEIGYYKYFSGHQDKRIEKIFDVEIPENCTKIKIGLRPWSKEGIFVHHAFLTILSI